MDEEYTEEVQECGCLIATWDGETHWEVLVRCPEHDIPAD